MSTPPPLPSARTALLIAGPNAGKTSLMRAWQDACPGRTAYFRLSPEDFDPAFMLRRFLGDFPEIKARFDALRSELPSAPWGALLGLALTEAQHAFTLFLDDFHLLEGTPHQGEWEPFLRHFPAACRLVISSRHRLVPAAPGSVVTYEPDDPIWHERASLEDLQALPLALQGEVLALHVVGESELTPSGQELIRRNIATAVEPGIIGLREAWREAAASAAALHSPDHAAWTSVERGAMAFFQRYLRTGREHEMHAIFARIPVKVLQARPGLIMLQGDLYAAEWRREEAKACFGRAMELAGPTELKRELRARWYSGAMLLEGEVEGFEAAMQEEERASFDAALWVRFRYWKAIRLWREVDYDQAQAEFQSLLTVPALGDRMVLWFQARAMQMLVTIFTEQGEFANAYDQAERTLGFALQHRLHRDLLIIFSKRLVSAMNDWGRLTPPSLIDVPEEAFAGPTLVGISSYLEGYAWRAFQIKAYPLALSVFRLSLQHARRQRNHEHVMQAKYGLMCVHTAMGAIDRSRRLYDEIRGDRVYASLSRLAAQTWAYYLLLGGHLDEAARVIERDLAPADAALPRVQLFRASLKVQRGDASAIDEVRAALALPGGEHLWDNVAELLGLLGLREKATRLHVTAIDRTAFSLGDRPAPRTPRKGVRALLAHLMVNPGGIDSDDLIARLFASSETLDPSAALHTLVYQLRQGMEAIGAPDLLESTRGRYRYRWDEVAFCDLHEFDLLYQKACALAERGANEAAATFYQLAGFVGSGTLFVDVEDPLLDPLRTEHAARLARAKAFVQAHGHVADCRDD